MKKILFFLALLSITQTAVSQIGSRYTRSSFSENYTQVITITSVVTGDDESSRIPLPFVFRFNNVNYDSVNVCTNGFINFGRSSFAFDNTWLFTTDVPYNVIAGWWNDLVIDDSSNVMQILSGTTPNRVFTLQWINVLHHFNIIGVDGVRLNFQIKLYETSDVIELCYGPRTGRVFSTSQDAGASMGIKGAVGGAGDFINAYSQSNVANDTLSANFSYGSLINRKIRFTPVRSSVSEISSSAPKSFALSQNYPNPFNPSTSINYQLQSAGSVKLEVFDMLGRSVGVLVDQKQAAGSFTATFNAGNLSSGAYFYRLQSGTFVQTKKMTLVK
jgi:hypothetical protein